MTATANTYPEKISATYLDEATRDKVKNVKVLTERLQALKDEWEAAEPQVYVDDTLLFTESWKETDGLPIDIRWAKAFQKRMEECPLFIRDDEIIVGSLTKFIRGNGTLCAMKPHEILKMAESGKFDRKSSDISSTKIEPEDLAALKEDAKYWIENMPQKSTVNYAIEYDMGEDAFDLLFDRTMIFEGRGVRYKMDRGLFQNYSAYGGGVSQVSAKCLDNGLNYVIKLAKDERERMMREGDTLDPRQIANGTGGTGSCHGTAQFLRKYWYLESIIISCEALITFAKRHADYARSLADKETREWRREELLMIADACDRVPAEPPRTFIEAVQSARFMHLAAWKESSDRPEVPIGRMDQYLWKYYEADKAAGRVDAQKAAEALGAFWLKIRECENLVTIPREQRAAPGSLLPNVTLCGVDENGNDLTNELSWIILEVMSQIKLSEPAVYVRYNPDMDPNFVKHALECNREFGGGNPAFLSDRIGTQRYLDLGVPIIDASNWNASGCLGYHLDSMEHMGGGYNLCQPKVLEVALNNGVDPRTGIEIGIKTGDLREAKTFDEVIGAYYKQLEYFSPLLMRLKTLGWGTEIVDGPMSGLRGAMQYEDCIPTGMASREGGARYPQGRASWFGSRGMVDLADTFAAIKKLVFDEKKVSMGQILDACLANWEGFDDIKQLCLNAPKYGNDDDYVDEIYDDLSTKVPEIMQSIKDPLTGETPMLFIGAAAGHVQIGKAIGALPNGRSAGTPVNDAACSVMPGMDVNGPTAAINSATRGGYAKPYAGFAMNMKFSKAVLNNDDKISKLASLIKAFNRRDGWHVQFNIHSREELLEAQEHPEKHKNLLVRVGGYSAYFIDLPPELQSEIVQRTMHEFV
ncbi:MAG: hypothetical protein LBL36_03860 [Clostridiales Family XIII bacterium]|jgi:formate C-acetyltransferase|nr:hypothetical protein [Clostridiales Family XIII bacterium]